MSKCEIPQLGRWPNSFQALRLPRAPYSCLGHERPEEWLPDWALHLTTFSHL